MPFITLILDEETSYFLISIKNEQKRKEKTNVNMSLQKIKIHKQTMGTQMFEYLDKI
jgi:hypothetical protein